MKSTFIIRGVIRLALALLLLAAPAVEAQLELKSPVNFNSLTLVPPGSRPVPIPQPASIGQPPANSQFAGLGVTSTSAGGTPLGDTDVLFPQAAYNNDQGQTVNTYRLTSARAGNSFATGVPRYYMGDEITPPLTKADGVTLVGAGENYWRRAPARPGEVFVNPDNSVETDVIGLETFPAVGAGGRPVAALAADDYEDFYYSPHADRVFASQPGTATLYWVANLPENGKYKIKKETFNVSSAARGEVRTIYWTEKSFNSPRVNIPAGRIQTVNPVYSKTFKPTVPESQEYKPPGFVENPDPNARPPKELRTLFFTKVAGVGQIGAYNLTGRILVEYLGAEVEPGRYEFLGMDIVEVARAMTSKNVTVLLGEQVVPEDHDTRLVPSPVLDLSQPGQSYYGTRTLPNGRLIYDAERENLNPDSVVFYWLESRDADIHPPGTGGSPGLSILWPKYQNRYLFVWPDELMKFAKVTVGAQGSTDATGIQFSGDAQPEISFQDDSSQTESRFDPASQRLITTLRSDGDGLNRTLLKFSSGLDVWYVRLFTQADGRDGYVEPDGLPPINTTATVGRRIPPPSSRYSLAGYISGGTGYQAAAYLDPYSAGVEAAEAGAIIPVNARPGDNVLRVRWFEKIFPPSASFSAFYVPSKVGSYTVSYPADLGAWDTTGLLNEARGYQKAVLLQDGRVLVTGGFSVASGILSTAELYDPADKTWTTTSPSIAAHIYHTMTVLPDGKVLVVDDTAEVFDPGAGTWTLLAPMTDGRRFHTATLLPDGRVLVAGGGNNGGGLYLNTAEIYDPRAAAWTAAGPMSTGRDHHTATLLPNGKVLIAGGQSASGNLATAELYDPATNTWSLTGSSGTPRNFPTATMLDNGKVLLVGGSNVGGDLNTSELYDPASGTWSATAGNLAQSRIFHAATLLPDGKVLVTAGAFTNSAELYDPVTSTWGFASPLQNARMNYTATLLPSGQVLVAGGWAAEGYSRSAELLETVSRIVMASNLGTADLTLAQAAGFIYQENDATKIGFNPNEEHAVKFDGRFFALRDDLNVTSGADYTSEPWVLVAYTDPDDGRPAMRPFRILREDTRFKFSYPWTAGTKIQGPRPLPDMPLPAPSNGTVANTEVPGIADPAPDGTAPAAYNSFTLTDRQGYKWVYRGPHAGGNHTMGMQWYYPMQAEFFIPGVMHIAAGSPLPYLRPLVAGVPQGHWVNGPALTISYTPVWPENPPELRVAETLTLAKFGLPDVRNQKSAEVYYQQSIARHGPGSKSVTLHDPTVNKSVPLGAALSKLPDKIRTATVSGKQYFQGLPPHLQKRFYLDPLASTRGTLILKGEFHDEISGEDYLDLNVLSQADEDALKGLATGDPLESAWSLAIESLNTRLSTYIENPAQQGTFIIDQARNRNIGANELADIQFADTARDSYALTATGYGDGYVTLLFGNGRNPALTPQGDPPAVKIIKVTPRLYTGDLRAILSDNPLDEKVSLRHSGDFAARPEDYEFEWRYGSATDNPQPYQYIKQQWLGDSAAPATAQWLQKRNPASALPGDFSVGALSLPSQVMVNDASHHADGGLPGLVLKSKNGVDFTASGIPANLVFSAQISSLDGFVLYVNGVEALAYQATANFTSAVPVSDLSPAGLDLQFALDGGFFVKGPNSIVVALYSSADPNSLTSIDFRLEGSTRTDQVAAPLWQTPGGMLGNIISTGGSPTAPLGSPLLVMQDNFFTMRYRPKINTGNVLAPGNDQDAVPWSDWAPRVLVEGWIKRVLARINPFNQRMSDLQNNTVNTDVSLLTQAGTRWEGDVALTMDALNGYGLIEIYETILNRGKQMSIDSGFDKPGVNDALLLAAGYLHDLYTILGNEAYADAANPTISIDDQTTITEVNTSRYSFESQVASVLDEELALLHGRDDFLDPAVTLAPFYNRLVWNYTRGIDAGEVLYAVNYNIKEKAGSSSADGRIDAADAQRMFPQGHGDAYGHYLTALKGYYRLLTHPNFTWVPRSETLNILGQTVAVDYQDERKFAQAAANVARTALQIVALVHRQQYHEEPADGWAHFRDGKENPGTGNVRHWGLDEWISRSGQGSYYNWVVGNAMLPDVDNLHNGIQRIDRSTVLELKGMPSAGESLQTTLDYANSRLNPLGLSPGAITFDISPAVLKAGTSHYEQIYSRALGAVLNAKGAFDQAAKMTRLLRNQENQIDDFNTALEDQERAFKYKMIDLYGTPYAGDKGPGKTYSQDYDGPDTTNWFVVDRPGNLSSLNTETLTVYDTAHVVTVDARVPANIRNFMGLKNESITSSPVNEFAIVKLNVQTNSLVQFSDQWRVGTSLGSRAVHGRIQQALLNAEIARTAVVQAQKRTQKNYESFERKVELFGEMIEMHKESLRQREDFKLLERKLNVAKAAAEAVAEFMKSRRKDAKDSGDAAAEAPPVAAGTSVDATSGMRAASKFFAAAASLSASVLEKGAKATTKAMTTAISFYKSDFEKSLAKLELDYSKQQSVYEFQTLYATVLNDYLELARLMQELQRAAEAVGNVIAEGERLTDEQEIFRRRAATVVQGYRTRDLTFRTFRNEGLEQYRTLFDLASRYTYLAAKSYDYETGLLGTPAGQSVISGIVSARALGDLTNGIPQSTASTLGDAGLAGTMAQLQADFSVAKGRLGINNPEQNGTLFSLRHELYRILNDPGSTEDDDAWQQTLEQHIVADVMADADVATQCRNIQKPDGTAVPGFVIPFSTTIQHGRNFFGLEYAAGDHNYTPSNFATKIYSVGIVLPGYIGLDPYSIGTPNAGGPNASDPNALGATPYLYLIPCGNDYMLAPPLGDTNEVRTWKVHDQALPLPFNLGAASFNSTQFFAANGTLSEQPWILRKHPAFRPVNDPAYFYSSIPAEFTNSRLVARSVWNGLWKIVIPAYSLLNNEQEGLNRFTASVKDIQLFLRTYSYSGN